MIGEGITIAKIMEKHIAKIKVGQKMQSDVAQNHVKTLSLLLKPNAYKAAQEGLALIHFILCLTNAVNVWKD